MNARRPLICATLLLLAASGCGGGASNAGGGGGGSAGIGGGIVSYDRSKCSDAPAALATAVSAKLRNVTLSHPVIVQANDKLVYLSARMEGPSQAGNAIATFALTSTDPATAKIYAVGPNASNYSSWQQAPSDLAASLSDVSAATANLCAKTP
jgi:hypothetical protein